MGPRIVTWNVNGIRNPFAYQPWREKRTFAAMFDTLEADIVILQETKIQRKDLNDEMVLVPGWDCFFSFPIHEKGKFGVVIYTRQSICAPIRAEEGLTGTLCPPNSSTCYRDLPPDQHIGGYPTVEQAEAAPHAPSKCSDFDFIDCEGRCVAVEFPAFVLMGLYNPATRDASRDEFRIAFLNLLDIRIRNLVAMGKRVIAVGDFNITKAPIDMAYCQTELRKQGLTEQEFFSTPSRRFFNELLDDGFIWGTRDQGREVSVLHDICRAFHPERTGMYTHWETKINARPGNYGARIDFILCSLNIKDWFVGSDIQEGLMGSDHCPVYAIVKDEVTIDCIPRNILDALNPPEVFSQGTRQRELGPADICALSGRLIPQFTGRRSIKDMFARQPSTSGGANDSVSANKLSNVEPIESNTHSSIPAVPDPVSSSQNGSIIGLQDVHEISSSLSPIRKRATSDRSPKQPNKRSKSGAGPGNLLKGQQSLKGFFRAKSSTETGPMSPETVSATDSRQFEVASTVKEPLAARSDSQAAPAAESESSAVSPVPDQVNITPSSQDEYVHDPIVSKESWSRLFSKPVAPLCEGHQEPCKTMTTRKPGANCGRSFWMCAKPLGPSGQKERGTEWRCPTFIWCSDWNTSTGS